MKYNQVYDGDWTQPSMKNYKMMCCSCLLVHRVKFKIKHVGNGHHILIRYVVDKRATAAARRKK